MYGDHNTRQQNQLMVPLPGHSFIASSTPKHSLEASLVCQNKARGVLGSREDYLH